MLELTFNPGLTLTGLRTTRPRSLHLGGSGGMVPQKIKKSGSSDPHNQKEHTGIHKIPKFNVNQASFD